MAKPKFYVVWRGRQPGIYSSWSECEAQTRHYSGARYKSYGSRLQAEQAWQQGAEAHWGQRSAPSRSKPRAVAAPPPRARALCVDAACNMQTRVMEYRGVWLPGGELAFARGPFSGAVNNVGEYLALLHACIYLKRMRMSDTPIYSDSQVALSWWRTMRMRSEAIMSPDFNPYLRARAFQLQRWLQRRGAGLFEARKWNTAAWGEIPADFGNK